MMLVTKCPNCHTVFKVVSDQLKISEGWVRCGQCNEIFDTTLNLREWDPEKPEDNIPPSIVTHEVEQAWEPSAIEPADTFRTEALQPVQEALPVATEPEPALVSTPMRALGESADQTPEPVFDLPPLQPLQPLHAELQNRHDADEFAHPPLDSQPDELVADRRIDSDDGEPELHAEERVDEVAGHHSFTADMDRRPDPNESLHFLNRERAQSAWDRPVVRNLLGLAVVILMLTLMGQYLIQERDRIATYVPSLRPVLEELCHGFGCKVLPLRQIESMTVESSSFNRFRGDTYRLGFVIRNSSDLELAKPALELTLTDSQDQAVYRRVLLPAELDPKNATMTRGEEWSESLVISLADGNSPTLLGSSKSVSGYRLLAFYP